MAYKVSLKRAVELKSILRKKCGNEIALREFLEVIHYEGYCDRVAEERNASKGNDEEFIKFKRGQDYKITCPKCGQSIIVDFNEMRVDSAKENLENVMKNTNWEAKYKIRR